MKKILLPVLTAVAVFLTGCGSTPQPTVKIDRQYMTNNKTKIGVYIEASDKATTHIYGASCLLCYGVASAANSSLSSHLESLPISDVKNLQSVVIDKLKMQGNEVQVIESLPTPLGKLPKYKGELGFARKDYRALKGALNIDTLIVINITAHGAYRTYNSYVPTSDPIGSLSGKVYTIDLDTNKYVQYQVLDVKVNVPGEWDEPPTFPGVTGSYYEAVERGKERIGKMF